MENFWNRQERNERVESSRRIAAEGAAKPATGESALKGAYFESALNTLERGLFSPLTQALAFQDLSNPANAMMTLKSEMAEQKNALKSAFTKESLMNFEAWAINKAGEKFAGNVATAFNSFRAELGARGISLE